MSKFGDKPGALRGAPGLLAQPTVTHCWMATRRLLRRKRKSPFYGSYLESYKVIPKRNYLGALGSRTLRIGCRYLCGDADCLQRLALEAISHLLTVFALPMGP